MTGAGIVVVVVAIQVVVLVATLGITALGFRNGDRPGDPRALVRGTGAMAVEIEVRNPSDAVVLVSLSRRRAWRARSAWRGHDSGTSLDGFLGAVDAGTTECWTVPAPGHRTRLRLHLSLPGRRLQRELPLVAGDQNGHTGARGLVS